MNEALATYRKEDIQNALHNIDELKSALETNHREVMIYVKIERNTDNMRMEYNALIQALGTLDVWLTFKQKANAFIKSYEALSPDPYVLQFKDDLKWIAGFIAVATMHFEKTESIALKNYSAKIREMLEKHLQVTGITTFVQLRHLTDTSFFQDFNTKGKSEEDINTAAVRKATELKKIIKEKVAENSHQYMPFSKRVMELIRRFESGLVDAVQMLKEAEELSKDIIKEDNAYKKSGLNKNAYGVYKILEVFKPAGEVREQTGEYGQGKQGYADYPDNLQKISLEIDKLYTTPETAPVGWHLKEQLKKELRQKIRRIIIPAGFTDWEKIPVEIENYALKHYVKIV